MLVFVEENWLFACINLSLVFVGQVHEFVVVRAGYLARLKVGLVHTFLAILKVETHVIVLE